MIERKWMNELLFYVHFVHSMCVYVISSKKFFYIIFLFFYLKIEYILLVGIKIKELKFNYIKKLLHYKIKLKKVKIFRYGFVFLKKDQRLGTFCFSTRT